MRYTLSSRWLLWHACCLVLVAVLVAAGAWQLNVALSSVNEAGEQAVNIRNVVYAFQWWIFAIFGVWFWWRYISDQHDADAAELEEAVRSAPDGQIGSKAQPEPISLDGSVEERKQRVRDQRGEA